MESPFETRDSVDVFVREFWNNRIVPALNDLITPVLYGAIKVSKIQFSKEDVHFWSNLSTGMFFLPAESKNLRRVERRLHNDAAVDYWVLQRLPDGQNWSPISERGLTTWGDQKKFIRTNQRMTFLLSWFSVRQRMDEDYVYSQGSETLPYVYHKSFGRTTFLLWRTDHDSSCKTSFPDLIFNISKIAAESFSTPRNQHLSVGFCFYELDFF